MFCVDLGHQGSQDSTSRHPEKKTLRAVSKSDKKDGLRVINYNNTIIVNKQDIEKKNYAFFKMSI